MLNSGSPDYEGYAPWVWCHYSASVPFAVDEGQFWFFKGRSHLGL